ncbi:GAF domain-containing protein [Mycobacterium sp. D16R24]|uniref:GAF domain-containing protein n=1 Tax=Mycobacterium sp. D16R24 TaxID=1855656 RepID=UPI00099352D8|nr:GAF domain-containing protein [Mycobacterium sp. D16R24]
MAREWLLLETLGDEPTVIASGNQPRNMVPLSAFLRRNRNLGLIRRIITAATKANRSASIGPPDSDSVIDIRPIAMLDGRVHGVWLWTGSTPPPAAPPAEGGAVVLNADTGALHMSDGAALAMGMAATEPHAEISMPELYRYLTPNPGETDVLGLMVTATEDMTYCATWPGVDSDGNPTLCHFASRLVVEPNNEGVPERLGRAINLRVGRSVPPVPLLEQRVLEAAAEPGAYRALVMIASRKLIKWIDPPAPEWHWEFDPLGRPKIHPDDEANLNFMIDNAVFGATEAVIRFRCHDDSWESLHCSTNVVRLSEDATVALITHRRRPAKPL